MQILAKNIDYDVSMESTHHGTTNIKIPSVYVEIESSETQWVDPIPGKIVASAILSIRFDDMSVTLGFGGGHYAPRQSKLLLDTDITFGHNFPSYQLSYLDKDMIRQAFDKSDADFVILTANPCL